MNKIVKIIGLCFFGVITLTGCGKENSISTTQKEKDVNDRSYSMEEIVGTYKASKYTEYGYTYEYTLTINNSEGLVHSKSWSFESIRMGIYYENDLAKGAVSLTDKNLFISDKKGYIQTIDAKLHIYICDIDFTK